MLSKLFKNKNKNPGPLRIVYDFPTLFPLPALFLLESTVFFIFFTKINVFGT